MHDTIVAVSSPPHGGGGDALRAIVRLSGPRAWEVLAEIAMAPQMVGWHPARIEVNQLVTAGAVMLFRGPRSFTGQDVAELHLVASPALLEEVLAGLLSRSAPEARVRLAEAGEFSARGFFNGKMDLTEAEGIAATISAASAAELRAAASLRQGDLHRWAVRLADEMAHWLALVEAGIDFSDEEGVRFVDAEQLAAALQKIGAEISRQLAAAVRIDRLAQPPTVAFIGKPNVGKSSLINALTGTARSIVSPIAGTTRDILTALLSSPAGKVRLLDVPGEEPATDELRARMMEARQRALLDADLIVEVRDPGDDSSTADHPAPLLTVWNKLDLLPAPSAPSPPWQWVSAHTGAGVEALRAHLLERLSRDSTGTADRLVLNHRHRVLLEDAAHRVAAAKALAHSPRVELLAAELRQALDSLGQTTGTISPDEVIGRIFSQFCIGK